MKIYEADKIRNRNSKTSWELRCSLPFAGPSHNHWPDSYGDGGGNVQKTWAQTNVGHTQRVGHLSTG